MGEGNKLCGVSGHPRADGSYCNAARLYAAAEPLPQLICRTSARLPPIDRRHGDLTCRIFGQVGL